MNFKQWLSEWEGNSFNQEPDLVNGPQFPNSKYKGKGDPLDSNNIELNNRLRKIQMKFGFRNDDELLNMNRKLRPARLDTSLPSGG